MPYSPLPWKAHPTMRPWAWGIDDAEGNPVASDISPEDAHYIVEQVNHPAVTVHFPPRVPDGIQQPSFDTMDDEADEAHHRGRWGPD